MNPQQILTWLTRFGVQVDIQELSPNDRKKNRVIVTYRSPTDGAVHSVGNYSVAGAVAKAAHSEACRAANKLIENQIPVADDF